MVSIASSPQSITRMSLSELERANASVTLIDLAASLAGDPSVAELRDDLLREKNLLRQHDRDQQDFASLKRHFRYPMIIEVRDQAIEHLKKKETEIIKLAPSLSLRNSLDTPQENDEMLNARRAVLASVSV